jgi:hypothetical protein
MPVGAAPHRDEGSVCMHRMLEAGRAGTGHNGAFGAGASSWAGFGSVPLVELMTGRILLRRALEDDAVDPLAMQHSSFPAM